MLQSAFIQESINLETYPSELNYASRQYLTDIARLSDEDQWNQQDLDFNDGNSELILEKLKIVDQGNNTVLIMGG